MKNRLAKWIGVFFIILLVNTAYVAAFATPSIFYMTNVLFHLGLGTALAIGLFFQLRKDSTLLNGAPAAMGLFGVSLALGLLLVKLGNTTENRWAFWAHIGAAGLGLAALIPFVWKRAQQSGGGWASFKTAYQFALVILVLLPAGAALYQKQFPEPSNRIRNPLVVPASMHEEGAGPKSPFFPSSANTNVNGIIPSNFFMDSEACGRCHRDIYEQWKGSAHHFASFNNQFYRKSIEYMQSVVGTQPSKWCAGCHDHAVFFNGRFDRPIKEQIDTPEAHAGLACTSCHSVVHVDSSMGNGGFTIEYPPLHDLAASENRWLQRGHDALMYMAPAPHRATFLKPFHTEQASEFCSTCHKVHLDRPVNHYRWFRGFNEYDNWQASAASGQGARSFYYPPAPQQCSGCHMPLVDSTDPAARNGKVRSQRFIGANTALPF